jgi:hypothetical protein
MQCCHAVVVHVDCTVVLAWCPNHLFCCMV